MVRICFEREQKKNRKGFMDALFKNKIKYVAMKQKKPPESLSAGLLSFFLHPFPLLPTELRTQAMGSVTSLYS